MVLLCIRNPNPNPNPNLSPIPNPNLSLSPNLGLAKVRVSVGGVGPAVNDALDIKELPARSSVASLSILSIL